MAVVSLFAVEASAGSAQGRLACFAAELQRWRGGWWLQHMVIDQGRAWADASAQGILQRVSNIGKGMIIFDGGRLACGRTARQQPVTWRFRNQAESQAPTRVS